MVTAVSNINTNTVGVNAEPPVLESETVSDEREVTVLGYQSFTKWALTIITVVGLITSVALMSTVEAMPIGIVLFTIFCAVGVELFNSFLDEYQDRYNNDDERDFDFFDFFNIRPIEPFNIPDEGIDLPRDYHFEDLEINRRHFEEVLEEERNIPEPPANIVINQVLQFVDKMNFDDEARPDHIVLREVFQRLGNREMVRNNLQTYLGTIRNADENTKKYLKLIIHRFSQIEDDLHDPNSPNFIRQNDPRLQENAEQFDEDLSARYQEQLQNINKRNQMLMQLAKSIEGCHIRQKMETYEVFRKVYNLTPTDFGDDIKERLLNYRHNLIYTIAAEEGYGYVDVHSVEDMLALIGPLRGITNNLQGYGYNRDDSLWRFDRRYNKEKLLELVKDWIDGIEGENGIRHREVEWERATEWFKDHVPERYRNIDPGEEYQNAEERYLYEHVYQALDETDYPQYGIKPDAVEYLLQTIGVVN